MNRFKSRFTRGLVTFIATANLLGVVAACGASSEPGGFESSHSSLAATTLDSLRPVAHVDEATCKGSFKQEDLLVAERRVRRRTCYEGTVESPAAPRETYAFIDDKGREGTVLSYEELRRYETRQATSVEGRLGSALLAGLKPGSPELVEVDVWYRFDEPTAPQKEALMASEEARSRYNQSYRAALVHGRGALEEEMAQAGLATEVLDTRFTAAPRLRIRATAATIHKLAAHPRVTAIRSSLESDLATEIPHSEAFYDIVQIPYLKSNGWDGNGIQVSNLEGALPDSVVNLNFASGNCQPSGFLCTCAEGQANFHPRAVMGVISNMFTSLRGGTASEALSLFANCQPGEFFSLHDVTVINRSAGPYAGGDQQTSTELYLDAVAMRPPYSLVTISAGNNGPTVRVSNNLRNGLVVGGADDKGNTSRDALKTIASFSQGANLGGALGWELPHLVAPAVNIASVGAGFGQVGNFTGTSFAAPQVAGIAAALQEQTGLQSFPEALIPALLVGPEQNVHGTWPLNLHDDVDDLDGVGAVNARLSSRVLSRKLNGGQAAVDYGFDHGMISSSNLPANSSFPETYNVFVPAGRTLRAAAIVMSSPTCGSPITTLNCTANDYPRFMLQASYTSPQGTWTTTSDNLSQNYQYLTIPPQSEDRYYKLRLYMRDWSGLTHSYHGIAFTSEQ